MVPTAVLEPANLELFAANRSLISVLGRMRLKFNIADMPLYADLYVSDAGDECMLGIDWLKQNCHWHFDQGILEMNGA